MPELVIHIGYPKCASTSLQENVFSQIGANYLGRRYRAEDQSDHYRFISGLLLGKQSPGCIPLELQAMVGSDFLSLIAEGSVEPKLSSEKLNIYSDEVLLFPYRFEEKDLAPERIKHIFGEESISYNFILIVRNQVDLIESFFAEKFEHLRVFKEINTPKHLWNYSGGVNTETILIYKKL